MEFPEGWGVQKTFHGRGMDIFWNNIILLKSESINTTGGEDLLFAWNEFKEGRSPFALNINNK